MVAADGIGCPTSGCAKRAFGIFTEAEAMGIRQAWQEGRSLWKVHREVVVEDGAAALETGDAQVNGGPRGETTRYWYSGTDTTYTQVVILSRVEARRSVSADREGGRLSLGGKSKDGRDRRGGGNNSFVTISNIY